MYGDNDMYLKHNPCYHCYSGAMCDCYYPEVGFCCELMDVIIDNCDLDYDGYVELDDNMVDKEFIEKYKKDIIFNENELKQYLNSLEKINKKSYN
jgi:hypothetical protein